MGNKEDQKASSESSRQVSYKGQECFTDLGSVETQFKVRKPPQLWTPKSQYSETANGSTAHFFRKV